MELRSLFPTRILRGGLLRPDGVAVGLVIGGTPPWDLMARAERAQASAEYHRLLLALDAPIDIYVVDQPPDVSGEVEALLRRQSRLAKQPEAARILADVLGEIADYLITLSQYKSSRAKQAIWAVRMTGDPLARNGLDLRALLGRKVSHTPTESSTATLGQVIERARRLADGLIALGGVPAPRLMEAEEIARTLYTLADPVRAGRYPLNGTLLDRVRRCVDHSVSSKPLIRPENPQEGIEH